MIPLIVTSLILPIYSEEPRLPPKEDESITLENLEIIKESQIQKVGHVVTIRKATPPRNVPKLESTTPSPVDGSRVPESIQPSYSMMISATWVEGHATFMEWKDRGQKFSAWSPIDFRHLGSSPKYKIHGVAYNLMCLTSESQHPGEITEAMSPQEMKWATAPNLQKANSHFVLIAGDHDNNQAMSFLRGLHEYYADNQDQLVAAYDARAKAREASPSVVPPPHKKDSTITYWKYQKTSKASK